jgi:hypothetical protein
MRRNAARERVVPPDIIKAMAAKLRIPELAEGFSRINSIHADRSSDPYVSGPGSRSY